MKISLKELSNLCTDILISNGLDSTEAEVIVEDYLDAELRGKFSHGLSAFSLAIGAIEGRGKYVIKINDGPKVFIDGNHDIGHIVGRVALTEGIRKADLFGIGIVGICNISRFSTPGTFARFAAQKDYIGIVLEYGGKNFMVPFGGAELTLSTNPIAIGIPTENEPFVLDMATSERAIGFINLARMLNTKIPLDWAVDNSGLPTDDPANVLGAVPFGGYKGFALALAIEILCGPLVRTEIGKNGNLGKRGALFIIISPELFHNKLLVFKKKVTNFLNEQKNAKKKNGINEIFIPGEKGERRKNEILKAGFIDIDDKILEEVKKLRK
jgi:ureidoglycolate dehydrogenase (NAD+)/L-2-hydroxycarboxylate dehydrogenase (NAD+)